MIDEYNKMAVVKGIIKRKSNRTLELKNKWTSDDQWLDQDGNIWALTDECWDYVERIKKMKAFL